MKPEISVDYVTKIISLTLNLGSPGRHERRRRPAIDPSDHSQVRPVLIPEVPLE